MFSYVEKQKQQLHDEKVSGSPIRRLWQGQKRPQTRNSVLSYHSSGE